jgi:uncharacterized membrane protein YfbV (UPF0208 family)
MDGLFAGSFYKSAVTKLFKAGLYYFGILSNCPLMMRYASWWREVALKGGQRAHIS